MPGARGMPLLIVRSRLALYGRMAIAIALVLALLAIPVGILTGINLIVGWIFDVSGTAWSLASILVAVTLTGFAFWRLARVRIEKFHQLLLAEAIPASEYLDQNRLEKLLGKTRAEDLLSKYTSTVGVFGKEYEEKSSETEEPTLVETTHRLARQAAVDEPDVYVVKRSRPLSYTVPTAPNGSIVLSTGLLEAVSSEELDPVLAHEIAHLATPGSRVMSVVQVPFLVADWSIYNPYKTRGERIRGRFIIFGLRIGAIITTGLMSLIHQLILDKVIEIARNIVVGMLLRYGQFGLAVLAKGRESVADLQAARLTGEPAVLAHTLAQLEDQRESLETSERPDWEKRMYAFDFLPAKNSSDIVGPYSTHPDTEWRIERLEQLATPSDDQRAA